MEFNLTYPGVDNKQETRVITPGELLFLVGPNGSGKSTLMHKFATLNPGKVRRITAHRQVWFHSDTMDLTPKTRHQQEQNLKSQDQQAQARYMDNHAGTRSQITIFDLIDAENVEARKIADAARLGDMDRVKALSRLKSPLSRLNDILKLSNLNIHISVDGSSKLLAEKPGVPRYSIVELSDGERNALLIIANVLTAPEESLILIDEPERHLHRSIVSPLISTMLSYRPDCAFVISTHDIVLPLDQAAASALLVREYCHQPQHWEIDHLHELEEMDQRVAEAILGSRRKILFIEGFATSLDLQIYQILYPEISIKPVGSCVDVERIVTGINSAEGEHWVTAIGVIDRDNRNDDECQMLIKQNVIPIEQYSVESIYYHPEVIEGVLDRLSSVLEINAEEVMQSLTDNLLAVIKKHKERMAARMVERRVKDALLMRAPNWKEIMSGGIEINFSADAIYDKELSFLEELIAARNIGGIISRYPIRETEALEIVSSALFFKSKSLYEQSVRKMLMESKKDKEKVLSILQPVTQIVTI